MKEMKSLTPHQKKLGGVEVTSLVNDEWFYDENDAYSDLEEGYIQPEGHFKECLEELKKVTKEHKMTYVEEDQSKLIRKRTLSSLQHLTKDLSFGDLFFSDKPSKADNDKATAETEAESMVSVTIQQDMSLIPPMTTSIIDLTSRPKSPKGHQQLKETATETTTTILPPPSKQQQSTTDAMMMKRIDELEHIMVSKAVDKVVTDAVDWAMQAPLRNCFRDLPEADMK
nr:hypothetical protein [Tanacetum cinerariifolium]